MVLSGGQARAWPLLWVLSQPREDIVMINSMTHIHVSESSRDCDGGHGYDYVITEYGGFTGREMWTDFVSLRADWFADLPEGGFKAARKRGLSWHMQGHTMRRWHDADGTHHVEYGGPTDEGFSYTYAYTCDDEVCINDKATVYDEYAEAAGY